jgi:peptide/nickel transport system permease protein
MHLRLLADRAVDLLFVVTGVSIIVFLMIRLIPGDAVAIMLGANTEITPERLASLRARVGLDRPLVEQYFVWAGKALTGDLGTSLWTGKPVLQEIGANIGVTLQLLLMSLVLGAGLALPAGCVMAYVRGGAADILLRIVTIAGITVPSFWLGIVMILLLATLAPGFPSLGHVPFAQDPIGNLQRMLLPSLALGLPILAAQARLVRSAMLDALGQDYVRTARAKGVSETRVVYKHALRNALIPFVTSVGITAGYLFGGAIVVEQVFALPGIGRLIVQAIIGRDYPVVQGTLLLLGFVFVLLNLAIDVLYTLVDPRIRYG